MQYLKTILALVLFITTCDLYAQTVVHGKIIDAATGLPIEGASVKCTVEDCGCGCTSDNTGQFQVKCTDCRNLAVTSIGYSDYLLTVSAHSTLVALTPTAALMDNVVVSANRGEAVKRSESPVAIGKIDNKMIRDAKSSSIDQLLNKVSGVNMVNLGNEQHQMSIRQPMTTKGLFLYLEDGLPIRTTGLFNHNALLEINMAATENIEVIKGPSSSLYGSEAIGGVVNFISVAPPSTPVAKVSVQANNIGYKRTDISTGFTTGKLGVSISGYYADKQNGYLEYSDFHKGILTGRADYRLSNKTKLSGSVTVLSYYSDMAGGIDSAMFADRTFGNQQTFTYRKVDALRYRGTLSHSWNDNSKSTVSLSGRNNSIGQNPAYRIKDDFRRVNGVYTGRPDMAHGEINQSSFRSYSVTAQHKQRFDWKNAVLIGGLNVDISPSKYSAKYISVLKDTVSKKYISYQQTDSSLSQYNTNLNNYAAFVNFEFNALKNMRVVTSLRYDLFRYTFDNHLAGSAFTGSADILNVFRRLSPKIGFTYNFSKKLGIYANYSQGFVPPQVSELYTGVKVPNIDASVFHNYEAGGWMQIIRNKLSTDFSIYRLIGTNEIVSVKLDDGSYINQNAGKTMHQGIEMGVSAMPSKQISIRFSGAYGDHQFIHYTEKGTQYDGNKMHNAPKIVYNAEIWYKPSFIAGFKIGAELQRVGSYFVDPQNSARYQGYYLANVRAAYDFKGIGIWLNVLNATNNYYSTITTKSSFGYSYQVAEPINFNLGMSCDISEVFKFK